jgi:hypothetical protein
MVKSQNESIEELRLHLRDMGNHKLESLKVNNKWAIVRKSKQYSFGLDFELIQRLGFMLSHMQRFNGKDEVIIKYVA